MRGPLSSQRRIFRGTVQDVFLGLPVRGALQPNIRHSLQRRFSAAVVEKVVEYLNFRYIHKDVTKQHDIPDFTKRIPPEIALEL
jgi:hypothetical protein